MNTISSRTKSGRKGYVIIVVVFIMILASIMSIAVSQSLFHSTRAIMSKYHKLQAFYNARTGIYRVIYEYMKDPTIMTVDLVAINNSAQAGDTFRVSTDPSCLFLVSTAGATTDRAVWNDKNCHTINHATTIGNLSAASKTIESIDIDYAHYVAYSTGSAVLKNIVIFGNSYALNLGSGNEVNVDIPDVTLEPGEFIIDAIGDIEFGAAVFDCVPDICVVGTFHFKGSDEVMRAVLTHPEGCCNKRVPLLTGMFRTMPNIFYIKSTGKVTSGGETYYRSLIAAYDVSYSKIKYLSESPDHIDF